MIFFPAISGIFVLAVIRKIAEPSEIDFVPRTAEILYVPEEIKEPILTETEFAVTLETVNSYFCAELDDSVKTILSPDANPFPVITTSEFGVTEMVPGIETPVITNVSTGGLGVSGFSQLTVSIADKIRTPAVNRIV